VALGGAAALHAFQFASALGPGLEGLPVRHRPVADAALRRAGFVGADLWRYMRRELPAFFVVAPHGDTDTVVQTLERPVGTAASPSWSRRSCVRGRRRSLLASG
jgi:hypothetical protein